MNVLASTRPSSHWKYAKLGLSSGAGQFLLGHRKIRASYCKLKILMFHVIMTSKDAFISAMAYTNCKHVWKHMWCWRDTHTHTHLRCQLQFNHFSQALHCSSKHISLSLFLFLFLTWKKFQFYVCPHHCSVYFGTALSVLPDCVSIVTATERFLRGDGF